MCKTPVLIACALAGFAILRADEQSSRLFIEGMNSSRAFQLEERKIALEERRVYLASLQGSKLTEEKAREISLSILKNLKDYPQGKKQSTWTKMFAFLIETLASIQKPTP